MTADERYERIIAAFERDCRVVQTRREKRKRWAGRIVLASWIVPLATLILPFALAVTSSRKYTLRTYCEICDIAWNGSEKERP